MKQEEGRGMKGEEMEKLLVEVIEPTVKRVYGMGIKDILDRISTISKELGEISKTISMLATRIDGIDKRIDDLWKVVVAVLGGTFGALIGIILMLIKLLIT
jgi:archaellum component FlaC